MGLTISTLVFMQIETRNSFNNVVQFYHPSETFSLDIGYKSDLFMFDDENLVILSDPSDIIVDIYNQ